MTTCTAARRRIKKDTPTLLRPTQDRDYRSMSRAVRGAVDSRGKNCPIFTVPGFAPPSVEGQSYHWTTPGGRPVYHPSAYSRAFGRPVYHGSTLRIVVGAGWLLRAALRAAQAQEQDRERTRRLMSRAAKSARRLTLQDAQKAGLCAAGVRGWCMLAGLDPDAGATLAEIVAAYRRLPRPEVLRVIRAQFTR
jgi:hypothetical protein